MERGLKKIILYLHLPKTTINSTNPTWGASRVEGNQGGFWVSGETRGVGRFKSAGKPRRTVKTVLRG